jgi:hypothetical protein
MCHLHFACACLSHKHKVMFERYCARTPSVSFFRFKNNYPIQILAVLSTIVDCRQKAGPKVPIRFQVSKSQGSDRAGVRDGIGMLESKLVIIGWPGARRYGKRRGVYYNGPTAWHNIRPLTSLYLSLGCTHTHKQPKMQVPSVWSAGQE